MKLNVPALLPEKFGFAATSPIATNDIGARWLARTAFSRICRLLESQMAASYASALWTSSTRVQAPHSTSADTNANNDRGPNTIAPTQNNQIEFPLRLQ